MSHNHITVILQIWKRPCHPVSLTITWKSNCSVGWKGKTKQKKMPSCAVRVYLMNAIIIAKVIYGPKTVSLVYLNFFHLWLTPAPWECCNQSVYIQLMFLSFGLHCCLSRSLQFHFAYCCTTCTTTCFWWYNSVFSVVALSCFCTAWDVVF